MIARKRRRAPPKPPPLPFAARRVWSAFIDMHSTRGGGFGPDPISFCEIDAWMRVTRSRLEPWEVSALRMVDDAYLQIAAEAAKRP